MSNCAQTAKVDVSLADVHEAGQIRRRRPARCPEAGVRIVGKVNTQWLAIEFNSGTASAPVIKRAS